MKGQDVMQFSAIALLAGLFWLQAGQDNTVLGCVIGVCLSERACWLTVRHETTDAACHACLCM
jgi:hypothetical protein